jgi:hypothetical protein
MNPVFVVRKSAVVTNGGLTAIAGNEEELAAEGGCSRNPHPLRLHATTIERLAKVYRILYIDNPPFS